MTDRWIPVTERLPGESGVYLVTTRLHCVMSATFNFKCDLKFDTGYDNVKHEDVIAWRPLPPPYEQTDEKVRV